jgi:hypothetical protein
LSLLCVVMGTEISREVYPLRRPHVKLEGISILTVVQIAM